MKKFYLIVFSLSITLCSFSQTAILHQVSGVKLYNGTYAFYDAVNASTSGDTIYLSGHGFATNNLNLDKKLSVYGAGHYPDSTIVTGKTLLNGSINLLENADGFLLEGVDLTGTFSTTSNHAINQMIIRYCMIQSELNIRGDRTNPSMNLMVMNSVVKGTVRLTNTQNAAIFNCILNADIVDSYGNLIQNSILLQSNYSSTTYKYTIQGDNNTIENCIYLRTADREVNGTNNIIKNNVTPKTTPYWGSYPVESGNYLGVDLTTLFLNQTGNIFDYTHNYHLQAPATYLGTDASEVGIYGGLYPYKEGAVPSNPHFVSGTIAPQTDADGKLNISIKVTAQDR